MMKELLVSSLEETERLARTIASLLQPGDVLTLEGDLGAGKTTFTKGLAKGLGIQRTVNSPTFTILKQYEDGRIPLNHMDVYRLAGQEEDLGWDELFYGESVTIIEWAHLIQDELPKERLDIRIKRLSDTERMFSMLPKGERYEKLCKEIHL
jgi:tRNA threonylcarbamoyladenosine biosynthesis protein TsaE